MWNNASGFMAIWSDVQPDNYTFYHDWLLKEHFPERVGVPGFLNARAFKRMVGELSQFFILYETQAPDVLASAPYVERLNNPTPMSREVMPMLQNFVRGAGRVICSTGKTSGGFAMTIRLEQPSPSLMDASSREALVGQLAALDRMLAVRLFEVEQVSTGIQTEEKKIRTSVEQAYSHLLLLEAPDMEAFEQASKLVTAHIIEKGASSAFIARYHLIGELQKRSLD